jgi:hypothetical protein
MRLAYRATVAYCERRDESQEASMKRIVSLRLLRSFELDLLDVG